MRIIDTHSHLYVPEFSEDIADVVERAQSVAVEKVLLPNINAESVDKMLALCRCWPDFFYPMMGLHPTDVKEDYEKVLDEMEQLLSDPHPFIAIGEVGLDYYWDKTYFEEQKNALKRQIGWATCKGLPLMIHTRSAHQELMELLSCYKNHSLTGVFHSFCGTREEATELLEFEGFMLGINGVLTFKNSQLGQVLKEIPLDRVVVETDAPYLSPVPYRGKRNESAYIVNTLRKMAEIYGSSVEVVAEQLYRNSLNVFPHLR